MIRKKINISDNRHTLFIKGRFISDIEAERTASSSSINHFTIQKINSIDIYSAEHISQEEYFEAIRGRKGHEENKIRNASIYFKSDENEINFSKEGLENVRLYISNSKVFYDSGDKGSGKVEGDIYSKLSEFPESNTLENLPSGNKDSHYNIKGHNVRFSQQTWDTVNTEINNNSRHNTHDLNNVNNNQNLEKQDSGFCFFCGMNSCLIRLFLLAFISFGLLHWIAGIKILPSIISAIIITLTLWTIFRFLSRRLDWFRWFNNESEVCGMLGLTNIILGLVWLLLLLIPSCDKFVNHLKDKQNTEFIKTDSTTVIQPKKTTIKTQGTLKVTSSHLSLKISDYDRVDGDIITIKLNGNIIAKDLMLKHDPFEIKIENLTPGENELDVITVDKGKGGGATPKIVIFDGMTTQKIKVHSNNGSIGRYIISLSKNNVE